MERQESLPTKQCADCLQTFPVDVDGFLCAPHFCPQCGKTLDAEWSDGCFSYECPGHIHGASTRPYVASALTCCPRCHRERRKKNVQVYPLCPMCGTPTHYSDYLRVYQGYQLDLIKICCTNCIAQFDALSESEQISLLHRAMVKAYGARASIYGLHYDESDNVHHIGRTKRLKTRMATYRSDWHRTIQMYSVLEELSFGPLSMERETRWILHALKHGWPIDNYDMPFAREEARVRELQKKETLTKAVAAFEPLTAPFEAIEPLLREFLNTLDAHIVHWFVEHQHQ